MAGRIPSRGTLFPVGSVNHPDYGRYASSPSIAVGRARLQGWTPPRNPAQARAESEAIVAGARAHYLGGGDLGAGRYDYRPTAPAEQRTDLAGRRRTRAEPARTPVSPPPRTAPVWSPELRGATVTRTETRLDRETLLRLVGDTGVTTDQLSGTRRDLTVHQHRTIEHLADGRYLVSDTSGSIRMLDIVGRPNGATGSPGNGHIDVQRTPSQIVEQYRLSPEAARGLLEQAGLLPSSAVGVFQKIGFQDMWVARFADGTFQAHLKVGDFEVRTAIGSVPQWKGKAPLAIALSSGMPAAEASPLPDALASAAREALSRLPENIGHVVPALVRRDHGVEASVERFGALALPGLVRAAARNESRAAARAAIEAHAAEAVPALFALSRDSDAAVKSEAGRALSRLATTRPELVVKTLAPDAVPAPVLGLLEGRGTEGFASRLEASRRSGDDEVEAARSATWSHLAETAPVELVRAAAATPGDLSAGLDALSPNQLLRCLNRALADAEAAPDALALIARLGTRVERLGVAARIATLRPEARDAALELLARDPSTGLSALRNEGFKAGAQQKAALQSLRVELVERSLGLVAAPGEVDAAVLRRAVVSLRSAAASDAQVRARVLAGVEARVEPDARGRLLALLAGSGPLPAESAAPAWAAVAADRPAAERALALELLPDTAEATARAVEALSDADAGVRAAAAQRLGARGRLGADQRPAVAAALAGTREPTALLLALERTATEAAPDAATIAAVVARTGDADAGVAARAIAVLSAWQVAVPARDAALLAQVDALKGAPSEALASALAQVRDAATVDALVERVLAKPHRAPALLALDPGARAAARAALSTRSLDASASVRAQAHAALDAFDPVALSELPRYQAELTDPQPAVRARAVRQLVALGREADRAAELGPLGGLLGLAGMRAVDTKLVDFEVERTLRPLLESVKGDADAAVRAEVAAALDFLGPKTDPSQLGLGGYVSLLAARMEDSPEAGRRRRRQEREVREVRAMFRRYGG